MDDRNDTIEWAIRYIEKVSDMTRTPEKQNLLAALKSLDVPETPPEDARELARTIVIDSRRINNTVRDTIDYSARLISAYADSIRKQCADRASTWFNNDEMDINNLETLENQEFSLRAAIMRKE